MQQCISVYVQHALAPPHTGEELLNTFAHYFKSLEYRRLEQPVEEVKPDLSRSQIKSQPGSQEKLIPGKKREPGLRSYVKTVISLLRLRTPKKRHVVISADLLFLEEKNKTPEVKYFLIIMLLYHFLSYFY